MTDAEARELRVRGRVVSRPADPEAWRKEARAIAAELGMCVRTLRSRTDPGVVEARLSWTPPAQAETAGWLEELDAAVGPPMRGQGALLDPDQGGPQ